MFAGTAFFFECLDNHCIQNDFSTIEICIYHEKGCSDFYCIHSYFIGDWCKHALSSKVLEYQGKTKIF